MNTERYSLTKDEPADATWHIVDHVTGEPQSVEACIAAAQSAEGRAYAIEHNAFDYTCSLGGVAQ